MPDKRSANPSPIAIIIPGILMSATGVGAGDLATASFAGSHLGTAVLWAVIVGALFKFVLTEGLARWQLATGQTFIEGMANHFGPWVGWLLLPYLFLWSFFVGTALMSACGVTLHALFPVFQSASDAKIVFGIISSLFGLGLVFWGGFLVFERIMAVFTGLMFLTVTLTAIRLRPTLDELIRGLLLPTIPDPDGQGLAWTMALIGGVGGTLTILCYGYWIREKGRTHRDDVRTCRIDLAVSYSVTALFGLSMVIIGSTVEIEGKGAGLLVTLANRLEDSIGPTGRWVFLVGAFGAVFSSLLGVWQAVPYLFADLWRLFIGPETTQRVSTQANPYRFYLIALALVPIGGLWMSFREVQKLYAVIGASFLPLLALALIILNGRKSGLGSMKNHWPSLLGLLATILFFGGMAIHEWFTN